MKPRPNILFVLADQLVTRERTLEYQALYNINSDPYELDNRLGDPDCAGIERRLGAELRDWFERMASPPGNKRKSNKRPLSESDRQWQPVNQ